MTWDKAGAIALWLIATGLTMWPLVFPPVALPRGSDTAVRVGDANRTTLPRD